ncbi:hypothetical protein ACTHQF_03170 [Pedobacter sp. SAFR-022]|uniref:hypothetical protein n=1 Tax=Pedobacter sp. SAFR-022 TaxID=3436861 RepID=UPI003F80EF0A
MDADHLSRKDFLTLTGRTVALGVAGTLAANGLLHQNVLAQTRPRAVSPPAKIPVGVEDPIVLEAWKSDVDQQSGATPTPLPQSAGSVMPSLAWDIWRWRRSCLPWEVVKNPSWWRW